ncbi:ankyrin repeat domain-containing protein 42-like isoform X1 [Rhopilema esculentum]|uniref:ankyrin repeat domain-containing protein 42-like isoform X1 n=2 Tax=Rhopilema esculentum TaxID=499914 RepID=UPI0031DF9BD2
MPSKKVQYSSVHEAVKHGDTVQMQEMFQDGASLNECDPKFKFTPLHWASHHGSLECLHWLLWHGADYSEVTPEQWTAAHIAAIRGQDACLQALAASGADMHAKDARGRTPAHLAAAHGNSYTLQSILRKGVDITALDNIGWSALHAAAFHGRLGCLQLLHRWGASLEDVDQAGNTPAHLAASEGHLHCLKYVISSSVSIANALAARNDQGETPRDLAQQYLKHDCLEYINGVEYDVNHPETAEDLTFPAHVAAYKGDLAYLQMLVETGVVSINERDDKGATPAHKAAGNGQIEVLKWLIEQGGNMMIVNSHGENPKDVARRFGKLACLKLLGGDTVELEDIANEDIQPDAVPEEPKKKSEARGRALRKVDELKHLLDIAKMNYRQLGGLLEEDEKEREEERENSRIIRELEAQLEYERERREKLESQLDRLRAKVHSLTLQLEDARSEAPLVRNDVEEERREKPKKKKKPKSSKQAGVFVLRGVSK